jgi:hypothetical protein
MNVYVKEIKDLSGSHYVKANFNVASRGPSKIYLENAKRHGFTEFEVTLWVI